MDALHAAFTEEERQTYVKHFEMYLQHGTDTTKFVVDLDDVWEYFGFENKGNAKKHLIKYYTEHTDFVVHQSNSSAAGGRPRETVMMNVETFKGVCLTARTERGKVTRKYYLKMERVFFEAQERAAAEAAARAEALGRLRARSETLISTHRDKIVLYLGRLDDDYLKLGWTKDIRTRAAAHRHELDRDFVILDVWPTPNAQAVEQMSLHHPDVQARRRLNGTLTEHIRVDSAFGHAQLRKIIERYLAHASDKDDIDKRLEMKRLDAILALLAKDMDPSLAFASAAPPAPSAPPPPVVVNSMQGARGGVSHGRLVLMYDASSEPPVLVRTFEGAREAARFLPGNKYDYDIRNAAQSNAVLGGYRWQLVDRMRYPDDLPPLPPTAAATGQTAAQLRHSPIAQLDAETRAIVAVHANQKVAAAAVDVKNASSISLAISRNAKSGGHRWAFYDALPAATRAAYSGAMPDPPAAPQRTCNRPVQQVDARTNEVLRTFETISAACKHIQGCHKSFHAHVAAGTPYRGALWRFVES
jgi:phage anti-repressor protein